MRKCFILFYLFGASLSATAQGNINKGDFMAGGQISYASSTIGFPGVGDITTNKLTLAPELGYFFVDKFAGGFSIALTNEKASVMGNSQSQSSTLFAPFVRYYFLPTEQKVNLFAQGGWGFGSVDQDGVSVRVNGPVLGAGTSIFLTEATALVLGISYTSLNMNFEGNSIKNNTVGFGAGFHIHLPGSR